MYCSLDSPLRVASRCVLGLLVVVLAGCGEDKGVTRLKIGHTLDPTHTVHKAMLVLDEQLQALSGGTMAIDIYPSGQLGSERELIELLQIGSLAMTKVSASPLESFVPEMKIFNIPYLFRDKPALYGCIGFRYWSATAGCTHGGKVAWLGLL